MLSRHLPSLLDSNWLWRLLILQKPPEGAWWTAWMSGSFQVPLVSELKRHNREEMSFEAGSSRWSHSHERSRLGANPITRACTPEVHLTAPLRRIGRVDNRCEKEVGRVRD